jgi:hypothetical protein
MIGNLGGETGNMIRCLHNRRSREESAVIAEKAGLDRIVVVEQG